MLAVFRRGASRRGRIVIVASAVLVLVAVAFAYRVRYRWYDGCNLSTGDQPALTVPISLVKKEPVASDGGLTDTRLCRTYGRRGYKVGPFGSVPTLEEADSPEWR
jgi:hypothetical protein